MNTNEQVFVNLVGLYTIVRREVARFIRIWSQTLLPSVISMALYFIVFGRLMGSRIGTVAGLHYIDFIAPGLVMMSIITTSYANVVASFFTAKYQKCIEELLVSPLPNYIILWGYVLGGVARGVLVGILVTIVSLLFTKLHLHHFWLTLLVGILTALLFSLAGFINGVLSKKFDDINIIPTFVLTPLTYLGGVFYSVAVLSDFWRGITHLNPIFYMVNAFRFGMLGEADIEPLMSIGIIVIFIVLLYGISLWLLRKGIGIKS